MQQTTNFVKTFLFLKIIRYEISWESSAEISIVLLVIFEKATKFEIVIVGGALTLKASITTAADDKSCDNFPLFRKNKAWYFMRIVCQQTILMKYHALFIILKKQQNL